MKNPGYFQYSRSSNPSRFALEQRYASLERTKYGLGFDDLYGGTKRLFNQWKEKYSLEVSLVDVTQLSLIEAAIQSNTKLIWLESPSNPQDG